MVHVLLVVLLAGLSFWLLTEIGAPRVLGVVAAVLVLLVGFSSVGGHW